MSDKAAKTKKPAKKGAKRTAKPETSVLGSLPATRPNRLGRHASAASSPTATAAAKPQVSAKPKTSTKAKPKTTAKAKPKTTAKAKPKSSAKPKASAKPQPAAAPRIASRTPQPTATSPTREQLRATAERAEQAATPRRSGPPSSAPELVTTAVQAAGEVAQIGVGLGVRALKRAARRLPGV
jgi:hypothetical protein